MIGDLDCWHLLRYNRNKLHILPIVQEGPEAEHLSLHVALRISQSRPCVKLIELHLQKVITADLPHLSLGAGHLVEPHGIL